MPDLITGTTLATIQIDDDTPHVLTQTAVVSVTFGFGIQLRFGEAVAGSLTVAGVIAVGSGAGVIVDGYDEVIIGQTGQIYALAPSGDGLTMIDAGNTATIAGSIIAADYGIFADASNTDNATAIPGVTVVPDPVASNDITISATGYVQGGSDEGNAVARSAAILLSATGIQSTLVNHGTIHADVSVLAGTRTAVTNAAEDPSGAVGLESNDGELYLYNTGSILGDILTQAGDDVIENAGVINGDIVLGQDADRYDGRGGTLFGEVLGGDGSDMLIGGASIDTLNGESDSDTLFGLDGADVLNGEQGEDEIKGGAGADTIYGGSNADTLNGGSGNDLIFGGSGFDVIFGDSGDDSIDGGSALDTIDGGSGNDDIRGGDQNDLIYGRSGDDLLRGEHGDDVIEGGSGDDTIAGGEHEDTVGGGSGDDRIFGGSGHDHLEGTTGNDFLNGGLGDDSLSGGSDDDVLDGDAGQDTMSGGTGADVFDFNAISDSASGSAKRDAVTDFETGVDKIDLSDISGSLSFVSTFTGVAGQVRYNDAVGRLYIDSDGDLGSDFQIDLGAGAGLIVDDLIL